MGKKDGSPATSERAGAAKSTLMDVARHAGVSHITVSRYFNHPDKLSPPTRLRVQKAVEALNYVPNAAAKTLARGNSELIALIVTDFTNTFFSTVARGVEDMARAEGYTLIVGNTDESADQERTYVDLLIAHRVRGVVLAPTASSSTNVAQLKQHDIPLVIIDREIPNAQTDVIRGDSNRGMYRLVQHMIDHGYRTIAFGGGQPDLSSLQDRLAGYRDAVREAGLAEIVYLGRYDRQTGNKTVDLLLREKELPDAIVAANSKVAVGILSALRHHGLRVPDDIAVASVDDIEPAAAIDPFLTVVDQPAYEIGRQAVTMLLERIQGNNAPPRKHILPLNLIVRRSCGSHR